VIGKLPSGDLLKKKVDLQCDGQLHENVDARAPQPEDVVPPINISPRRLPHPLRPGTPSFFYGPLSCDPGFFFPAKRLL
jgi:hypothetical protein